MSKVYIHAISIAVCAARICYTTYMTTTQKKTLLLLLAGFFIGILWFISLRFFLIEDKTVHYHANFNVYINGQKDPFDDFTQYEEVQACSGETKDNPRGRGHLHKPNAHVVHVHDDAVTWSAFFANVGYGVTDKAVTNTDGVFVPDTEGKKLTFILNGQEVSTIANRIIGNKDALLINYGTESAEEVKQRYENIPKDAEIVNTQFDPASCSGTKEMTPLDKLKGAVDFTN